MGHDPTCSRSFSLFFLSTLFLFSLVTSQQISLVGCYKYDDSFTSMGVYIFQSSGACTKNCSSGGYPLAGLSNGNICLCGSSYPSTDVSSSYCSMPCVGYDKEDCGADGYMTVWTTGLSNVQIGNSNGTSSSSTATTKSTASPTVVYITTGGVTVTQTRSSPTETSASSSGGGGTGGGIGAGGIAGIVVGILLVAAIGGGLFIFFRRRRLKNDPVLYPHSSATPFVGGGGMPQSDPRLEPQMMQRRISEGSLADEQDYSRKILRVVNG